MMVDSFKKSGEVIAKGVGILLIVAVIGGLGVFAGYMLLMPKAVPLTIAWFVTLSAILFEIGRNSVEGGTVAPIWAYLPPAFFGGCMGVTYLLLWTPGV